MNIIRFDVDKDQDKPILIPQYCGKMRIFPSKHEDNRLVFSFNHNTWEFNKFDILTGINLITGVTTIEELKEKYNHKSNSIVKRRIRKFIKFHIRLLKKLLEYFN